MKKRNKFILPVAIIGLVVGTLFKLQGYKTFGDVFLGISTLIWLFFIYTLIFRSKKQAV
jgi:tellurite resistance protein TehA-like permease